MSTQVITPAGNQSPGNSKLECRVYERHTCEMPAKCQPASSRDMHELRWAATIVDISQGGVRLILQRRFERNTGLALELPGDGQNEPSVVFVKVVHLRAESDGSWSLGCKFISPLSDDEVQRLVHCNQYVLSTDQESGAEELSEQQFETPRLPEVHVLNGVSVEIEIGHQSKVRCWIKQLDVSKCWPMTAGKVLTIGGQSKDATTWSIKIEVLHLTQNGTQWHLRGRVVSTESASGLLRVLGRIDTKR